MTTETDGLGTLRLSGIFHWRQLGKAWVKNITNAHPHLKYTAYCIWSNIVFESNNALHMIVTRVPPDFLMPSGVWRISANLW